MLDNRAVRGPTSLAGRPGRPRLQRIVQPPDDRRAEDLGSVHGVGERAGDGLRREVEGLAEDGHEHSEASRLEEVLHGIWPDGGCSPGPAPRGRASRSVRDGGTPARLAMAIRWITEMVEPPKGEHDLDRVVERRARRTDPADRPWRTIAPADAAAMRARPESAAGIEEAPGQRQPQGLHRRRHRRRGPTSCSAPATARMGAPRSRPSSDSDGNRLGPRSAQKRQTSEPEPRRDRASCTRSMGPASTKTNGGSARSKRP